MARRKQNTKFRDRWYNAYLILLQISHKKLHFLFGRVKLR
jgi:hypothetical protein